MSALEYEGWAMLDPASGARRAGFVREVEIAGITMLRVDIPVGGDDVTEYYAPAAVHVLRPCTEQVARDCASRWCDPRPVRPSAYRDRSRVAELEDDEA